MPASRHRSRATGGQGQPRRRLVLGSALLLGGALALPAPRAAASPVRALTIDAETAQAAAALLGRALSHLEGFGAQAAYADFTFGSRFKSDGRFVVVYELQGRCLAHGGNPRWVGHEQLARTDSQGRPFVRWAVELAAREGRGWVGTWREPDGGAGAESLQALLLERRGAVFVGSQVELAQA